MNGQVVELPITLAQDHTVFVILRRRDAKVWLDKAEALRRRGGMALISLTPTMSGSGRFRRHTTPCSLGMQTTKPCGAHCRVK